MFESQKQLMFHQATSLVYPRKLDTALRASTAETFLKHVATDNLKYDDTFFIQAVHSYDRLIDIPAIQPNIHVLPHVFSTWLHTTVPMAFRMKQKHVNHLTHTLVNLQLNYETKILSDRLKKLIGVSERPIMERFSQIPDVLTTLKYVSHLLEQAVESLSKDSDITLKDSAMRLKVLPPLCHHDIEPLETTFVWSNDLLYIRTRQVETIVPRHYLLLLHNKISDILSILMYAWFSDGITLDQHSFHNTLHFITDLMTVARLPKQRGYRVCKVLEALGTGLSLEEADGPVNRAFLQQILDNLMQDYAITVENRAFYQILTSASMPYRHELMCLSKVCGHPFVSMVEGTKVLYRATHEDLELSDQLIINSVRYAKRGYIKAHILRTGRWPPCHPLIKGSRLDRPWRENMDPDSQKYILTHGPVPIWEYDYIEFLPNMKFDVVQNLIPHLKDKTITLLRSPILQTYLGVTHKKAQWSDTRQLLYFLMHASSETDHLPYLRTWCDENDVDWEELQDYLIIRIVPKEKELKEEFRGFGCKTYLDRARSTIQELNVAAYLDLYSQEQAMTLGELGILKKLSSFRRIGQAYKEHVPLYIVIDASKWNNKFRHETVAPVMEETLDKIFGQKIFSRTMLGFENTLVYIPDKSATYYWTGQKGGIEGLNQYTWDTVYLAQIRACLHDSGHNPILFAKGDDLRAIILLHPTQLEGTNVDEYRLQIVQELSESMKKLGHDINVTESYGSTKYFAFSKSASVGCIEMPQTFRKIQKVYGANNAFLPFLDDFIASAFSNAHSAAQTSSNPLACYITAVQWMYIHLLSHPVYEAIPEDGLIALGLIPSLVGGLPIIYLHNIWVRAESDLLPPFLDFLMYTHQAHPGVHRYMKKFLQVSLMSPRKAFIGLLKDPYSLPIKKPLQPTSVLRSLITPALKHLIRNDEVKKLVKAADSRGTEELIDVLFSADVYAVKVLSAIYSASPSAFLEQILRKFESSRSTLEILILRHGRRSANRTLFKTLQADRRLHQYRLSKLTGSWNMSHDLNLHLQCLTCPSEQAQVLREYTWGKRVEGITMPPVAHQLSLALPDECYRDPWAAANHFEYYLKRPTQTLPDVSEWFSAREDIPFLGFTTRSGLLLPTLRFVEKDEFVGKIKNLIDLLSWVTLPDMRTDPPVIGNLSVVIYELIRLYTDIDPTSLAIFQSPRRSGTQMHHVISNNYKRSIIPNMLSNYFSRFKGNSNTHITFRSSGVHHQVNFLQLLCHTGAVTALGLQLGPTSLAKDITFWGITTQCTYCSTPICESAVSVTDPERIRLSFPDLKSLRLAESAKRIIELSRENQPCIRPERDAHAIQLPEDVVFFGILENYFGRLETEKRRIQQHGYHHQMDLNAFDLLSNIHTRHAPRQSADSELKRVPIEAYYSYIFQLCVSYTFDQWPNCMTENIGSLVQMQPPTEFPWYPVCVKLQNLGRLTHLVKYVERLTQIPSPAVYDSAAASSVYICEGCWYHYRHLETPTLKYVYLSDFDPDQVMRGIRPIWIILKYHLFQTTLATLLEDLTMRSSDDYKMRVLTRFVLFWSCPMLTLDELQEHLYNTEMNSQILIPVIHRENVYHDDLDVLLEDIPKIAHNLFGLNRFKFATGELMLDSLLENLRDVEFFENQLEDLFSVQFGTQIELTYTTIAHCIAAIRLLPIQRIRIQGRPSVVRAPELGRVQHAQHDRHFVFRQVHPNKSRLLDQHPWYPGNASKECVLKFYSIYRIYGFGTSAPSKLYYIFQELGLGRLPDHGVYACLGDGQGGFLATIDLLTRGSLLIFNTLTLENESEYHPSAYKEDTSENELAYQANLEGFTDLTHVTTLLKLEQYYPHKLTLVTCDAQTVGMDMNNRQRLIDNVITYFLRNGAPTALLILKLYSNEHEINLRAIGKCLRHCKTVSVIKPQPSGYNEEIYLVVDSILRPWLLEYDDATNVWYPNSRDAGSFRNWCRMLSYEHMRWKTGTAQGSLRARWDLDPVIPLTRPEGLVRLQNLCGIVMTLTEWTQLYETKATLLTTLEARLDIAVNTQISALQSAVQASKRRAPEWDHSTFGHKRTICLRISRTTGALKVLQRYKDENYVVTNDTPRNDFEQLYRTFPASLQLPDPDTINIFTTDFSVLGHEWGLYLAHLEGWHAMMMVLGYLNTH